MIKRIFSLGILLLLAGAHVAAFAAGAASLREISIEGDANGARVTLDLDRSTTYKLFKLDNPHRVVVDLRGTKLSPKASMPAGAGAVTQIRTGIQPHNTLRVVLQLSAATKANAVWANAEHNSSRQLVVSLGDSAPPASDELVDSSPGTSEPHAVKAAHAPANSGRDIVIAVDAGHGGQDPGAIGRNGTREKDVVLAIARALAKRINDEPGMRAILTRDTDKFLPHRERIRRARDAKADLFVSVHADSIRNRDVSGSSVYVLSERGATDESARWLAERENAADLMGGVSLVDKDNTLASVLLDLSNSANISTSMDAARRVLESLDGVGEVRKPAVQQAGFLVLKSPDIPSMLVETAYISNPAEERRLRSDSHQTKLAGAIFSGVRRHFEQSPPAGTRFAQQRRSGPATVLASPAP